MRLRAAIPLVALFCLAGFAPAQQHVAKPAPKPGPVIPPPPEVRSNAKPDKQEKKAEKIRPKLRAEGPGSAENLEKLLKMTPEQRNKALSSLPPGRRAQIENRLNDYQKMPAPERARALEKLKRMQSLAPPKQAQVRASLQKLATLPQPRHALVQREINRTLAPLSDIDRRSYMNSEEFRSKFTPTEQQIIEDICLVTPQK